MIGDSIINPTQAIAARSLRLYNITKADKTIVNTKTKPVTAYGQYC